MRVLIIGSGGREHALAWAIAKSPRLNKLFCSPGNPGTAQIAENVLLRTTDIQGIVAFAVEHKIDLVVPGPEAPLVAGIADALAAAGIACCGPSAAAAQLEGSKKFTKEVAEAAQIPTAKWASFTHALEAHEYVEAVGAPIVIKADGLAAGKGVVVAVTPEEAHEAITAIMEDRVHGAAGALVVIEQCLVGEEISVFALCDGEDAVFFGAAADHKRVGENDTGPNTGGMGAIFNPPWATPEVVQASMDQIIRPALKEMARRGTPFRGFLFAGLMVEEDGPKLIEFNVRFGDPECETVLPMLKSDLLPALLAATNGTLKDARVEFRPGSLRHGGDVRQGLSRRLCHGLGDLWTGRSWATAWGEYLPRRHHGRPGRHPRQWRARAGGERHGRGFARGDLPRLCGGGCHRLGRRLLPEGYREAGAVGNLSATAVCDPRRVIILRPDCPRCGRNRNGCIGVSNGSN